MADLTRLPAFLAGCARRGFQYGANDCLLWLADWAVLNGWPDPAARWRGRYFTALGCRRLVGREGGVIEITASSCASVGIARIEPAEIRPGDFAVGDFGGDSSAWAGEPFGLIRTRIGCAALLATGMVTGPARVRAAWRV